MRHKIGLTIVSLHISAALYVIVGVLMLLLFSGEDETGLGLPLAIGMCVLCLALAAGVEVVVFGLHQRKFWAWVAGLCICGTYVPSLFLPLGALGLWGLLDSDSRAEFTVGTGGGPAEPGAAQEGLP